MYKAEYIKLSVAFLFSLILHLFIMLSPWIKFVSLPKPPNLDRRYYGLLMDKYYDKLQNYQPQNFSQQLEKNQNNNSKNNKTKNTSSKLKVQKQIENKIDSMLKSQDSNINVIENTPDTTEESEWQQAGSLLKYVPGESRFTMFMNLEKLSQSKHALLIRKVIRSHPGFKLFFGNNSFDLLVDFKKMIMATADPFFLAPTFIITKTAVPQERIFASIDNYASEQNLVISWTIDQNMKMSETRNKNKNERFWNPDFLYWQDNELLFISSRKLLELAIKNIKNNNLIIDNSNSIANPENSESDKAESEQSVENTIDSLAEEINNEDNESYSLLLKIEDLPFLIQNHKVAYLSKMSLPKNAILKANFPEDAQLTLRLEFDENKNAELFRDQFLNMIKSILKKSLNKIMINTYFGAGTTQRLLDIKMEPNDNVIEQKIKLTKQQVFIILSLGEKYFNP